MFQKIKNFIKEDEQYFSSCQTNIIEQNNKMLRKGSIVYAFVLGFYTIFMIAANQPQVLRTMYYVFDVLHLCLCLVIFVHGKSKENSAGATQFYCGCLEVSILGFFALEGVFTSRTQHSLYIPIAILLVLLLFVHKAAYIYTTIFLYILSFAVLSFLYKTPEASANDIYIAIATLISSNIGYVLIAQMRHSEGTALLKYERLSQTDQLTGLYNKVSIQKICERLLRDTDSVFPFIILDLDNFKKVNDQYGHDVGDEVLRAVSHELKSCFRETDYIGRFGGDEFIILMDNCRDVKIMKARVEALLRSIERLTFSKEELKIQCSVGITLKHNNDTVQAIFKRADTALYKAKNRSKGCYEFIE